MKTCSECRQNKPLEDFPVRHSSADGRRGTCRECQQTYFVNYRLGHLAPIRSSAREWVTRNREQAKASNEAYRNSPEGRRKIKERQLVTRYGLTPEDKAARFEVQGRRCACCGTTQPGRNGWHIDHDHQTGEIRGITCGSCNTGIGMLGDTVDDVVQALHYLQCAAGTKLAVPSIEEHW